MFRNFRIRGVIRAHYRNLISRDRLSDEDEIAIQRVLSSNNAVEELDKFLTDMWNEYSTQWHADCGDPEKVNLTEVLVRIVGDDWDEVLVLIHVLSKSRSDEPVEDCDEPDVHVTV